MAHLDSNKKYHPVLGWLKGQWIILSCCQCDFMRKHDFMRQSGLYLLFVCNAWSIYQSNFLKENHCGWLSDSHSHLEDPKKLYMLITGWRQWWERERDGALAFESLCSG